MDWQGIKGAWEDVVRDCVPGAPSYEPRWASSSERNQMADPATGWKVVVDLLSIRTVSRRQEFYEDESAPGELKERFWTNSVMTFSVACEASFFDQDASRWAAMVVQRVKERIRFSRYAEQFREFGMSISGAGDTVNVSRSKDGREISIFSVDLPFNVFSEENDDDPVEFFDSVIVTSEIADVTGTLIPGNYSQTIQQES